MFIARVVGTVWATRKHSCLQGYKMLLVQQFQPESGKKSGPVVMALDRKFGAGIGDTVLIIDEGGSARQILDDITAPVRTVVIGVLDCATVRGTDFRFH